MVEWRDVVFVADEPEMWVNGVEVGDGEVGGKP